MITSFSQFLSESEEKATEILEAYSDYLRLLNVAIRRQPAEAFACPRLRRQGRIFALATDVISMAKRVRKLSEYDTEKALILAVHLGEAWKELSLIIEEDKKSETN